MPWYDYRCVEGHVFDRQFPLGQAPERLSCPHCRAEAARVWHRLPVIFRPTGWDRSPEDPAYWRDLTDKEERPQCLR